MGGGIVSPAPNNGENINNYSFAATINAQKSVLSSKNSVFCSQNSAQRGQFAQGPQGAGGLIN